MIRKDILKKLPIEYQNLKKANLDKLLVKNKFMKIDIYESDSVEASNFHRPISKMLSFINEK